MSGRLVGNTPWGRTAIASLKPEVRKALEARIPDGYVITVAAKTRPGDWSVRLIRDGAIVASALGVGDVEFGCRRVLADVA